MNRGTKITVRLHRTGVGGDPLTGSNGATIETGPLPAEYLTPTSKPDEHYVILDDTSEVLIARTNEIYEVATPTPPGRRIRLAQVHFRWLLEAIRKQAGGGDEIPHDTEVAGVEADYARGLVTVALAHPSFPESLEGEEAPLATGRIRQ